jgi:hypothetical protein
MSGSMPTFAADAATGAPRRPARVVTVPADDQHWVFDLVSPVVTRRRAALSRHHDLLGQAAVALQRMNALWIGRQEPGPRDPRAAASWDQAQRAFEAARGSTIFGQLDRFLVAGRPGDGDGTPVRCAVLFLQWERSYPHEWAEAGTWTWSHWTTKELLLRRFAGTGVPAAAEPAMTELVRAAVTGPYRCKDWRYAAVARRIDGARVRRAVDPLLDADDQLTRLRARFLRYLLDDPEVVVRRGTWRRWCEENRGLPAESLRGRGAG